MFITFQKHGIYKLCIIIFKNGLPSIITLINDNTIQKRLNTRSNIKESILRVFFSSYFLRKEKKKIENSHILFDILKLDMLIQEKHLNLLPLGHQKKL